MLFRLSCAVLALSALACTGSPRPATETAAPAIQHFFGAEEEAPRAPKEVAVASPAPPPPARVPEPAPEVKAPEAPPVEPAPQPAEAAPRETSDAIQHFFGETAVQPEEPAKDQKDSRDVKDGEKVDAFEHFFGEKPPVQ